MEEPSVLDYVKAKLAFWKHSSIEMPADQPAAQGIEKEQAVIGEETGARVYDAPGETALSDAKQAAVVAVPAADVRFPWAAVAPLLLAMFAQLFLEPPDRMVPAAVVLYLISAGVVLLAYVRRTVEPAPLPAVQPLPDNQSVRWEGLIIGGLLMLATFASFGAKEGQSHDFNFLNTSFWLLSMGYLAWGLAVPRHQGLRAALARTRNLLRQPDWKLHLSRWALLLLVVVGITLFYRFYRLESLPAEMVSDHAEKLLDVQDVLKGDYHIFFPRNTGREFFQFYWTALMVILFDIPVSFMALKMGTVIAGLITLLYIYRLGFELGNRWVALLALAFCGVSYWGNIQSRIGLRFPLYPLFAAPLLFYLLRGIRNMDRNDFIKAGLVLGLGLHGYTSFRIVPLLVVVAFMLYILHESSAELRKRAFLGLVVVVLVSLAVFMPLARFAVDEPDLFIYRSITRMGETERPLPGPAPVIFLQNTWNALIMFFYDDGDVWVHSVTHRPALDIVSAALFFIGLVLVAARYVRRRHWLDLFMLVSIPILLMPSILSLAFPNENPNLNRTAAAYIPAFLLLGIGLDALLKSIWQQVPGRLGILFAWILGVFLFGWASWQNYDLLFHQYDESFRAMSWNSTEMGAEIRNFEDLTGGQGESFVVAYPYWVDTRLVGVEAGHPDRDMAISPEQLPDTRTTENAKLFVLNREDVGALQTLQDLYPEGRFWVNKSATPNKDFILFMVPPAANQAAVEPGGETE